MFPHIDRFEHYYMTDNEFEKEKKCFLRGLYRRGEILDISYHNQKWFIKFWPRLGKKLFGGV